MVTDDYVHRNRGNEMTNPIPVYYVVRKSLTIGSIAKIVTHAMPEEAANSAADTLELTDPDNLYFLVEALKPMVAGR
jgi:hypothetical protein